MCTPCRALSPGLVWHPSPGRRSLLQVPRQLQVIFLCAGLSLRLPACHPFPHQALLFRIQDRLLASAPRSPLRSEVEASFPDCPPFVLARFRGLTGAANLSAERRVLRASVPGVRDFGPVRSFVEISRLRQPLSASRCLYHTYRDVARAIGPIGSSGAVFHDSLLIPRLRSTPLQRRCLGPCDSDNGSHSDCWRGM